MCCRPSRGFGSIRIVATTHTANEKSPSALSKTRQWLLTLPFRKQNDVSPVQRHAITMVGEISPLHSSRLAKNEDRHDPGVSVVAYSVRCFQQVNERYGLLSSTFRLGMTRWSLQHSLLVPT